MARRCGAIWAGRSTGWAERTGWLERCMQAMAIRVPKALLWQRIRALRRVL